MKRLLILCLSMLVMCSSVAAARSRHDDQQQTPERPRRAELPSFLGVELGEVSGETVSRLKLREERGALIESVVSGSSAAQAGLQKNDVIVKWDGKAIESASELSRHISETPAGRAVRLTVMRDGREVDVNVTLGERTRFVNRVTVPRPAVARVRVPDVAIGRMRGRHIGVELQSMTPQLAEYFGLSKRSGALVIFVFADSPAAKAGLKAGDVILSAAGETVENPSDLRRVLSDKSEGAVEFRILRDKQEQTVKVQLEKGTNSWLLAPDDSWDRFHFAISPVDLPKIAIAPMSIRVPAVQVSPRIVRIPSMRISPIAIPEMKLAPMNLEIPQIKFEPMNLEIPKIHIEPMKIRIAPRRILL